MSYLIFTPEDLVTGGNSYRYVYEVDGEYFVVTDDDEIAQLMEFLGYERIENVDRYIEDLIHDNPEIIEQIEYWNYVNDTIDKKLGKWEVVD